MFTLDEVNQVIREDFGHLTTPKTVTLHYITDDQVKTTWDGLWGSTDWHWEKWSADLRHKDRSAGVNGFTFREHVYVVTSSWNAGTLLHEMLHVNAHADWRPRTTADVDEAVTDWLKRRCLRKRRVWSPDSYNRHIETVDTMVAAGVPTDVIERAYFCGHVAALITAFELCCAGSWSSYCVALNLGNFVAARQSCRAKGQP